MSAEHPDIDVHESERFAQVEAVVERVGWLLLLVFIVLGALGVFGNGVYSHRTLRAEGGEVEYQRFARNQGRTSLQVAVEPGTAEDGEVEVWLAASYLRQYEIEEVTPQPERADARDGGIAYVFAVPDRTTALDVSFRLVPGRVGRHRGVLSIGDGQRVRFTQLVYP